MAVTTIGVYGHDGKTLLNVDFPTEADAKAAIARIRDAIEAGSPKVLALGDEAFVRPDSVSHATILASMGYA